ncbi:DUF2125 domain-containing protein [Antarcticirhabdus aurantiaca]|uniref:DUF2125 domain-containing protein n=1 Tax=Antarcticirhabdus aurantiaca TaxID=2606717 RepID=A0ACD4NSI8_9HYPH|nr:DUF2125 domain-containing protein [Antarcticirhabdus aurantiaca]WAJ29865.1 DUF2125 domain-containing protein [Jeongeuplla avenae]
MTASSKGNSGARRAVLVVGLVAVVLAALLTGAWFYAAREIDRRTGEAIAAAAANGATIDCAGRETFGYPFRIGLSCSAVGVDAPSAELRATGGALRTAAQIYDPGRIVAELDGPLFLDTRDLPPLDLRWELAQASLRFGFGGLQRGSLSVRAPDVALAQPAGDRLPVAVADRFELHLRGADGNLDFASTDRGLRFVLPALASLPAMEASFDLSVTGAEGWLASGMPRGTAREVLGGREGVLRSARVDAGMAGLELSGPWRVSPDGLLSGEFRLAIAEPQQVADIIAAILPDFAPIANQTASAVGFFGVRENGRSVLPLTVKDGAATLGVVPLGRIPPLE